MSVERSLKIRQHLTFFSVQLTVLESIYEG